MKQKTCKICKEKFTPSPNMFCPPTCTRYECMVDYANKHLAKKAVEVKKENNKQLKAFKENDKTILKALAQKLINQYARKRDEKERGYICCTCGHSGGQMDGGHFLPTSGYSAIRYNTNQIHQQCKNCNRFNGGRPKEYRVFMINKYGLEYVENLEATKNITRSYSVEYYQKLIRVVKKKLKRLV